MSNEAHFAWAKVAYVALMVALVVICTTVVAVWAGSAHGLWSLLVPLFTAAEFCRGSTADK